jgi:hypothetical protein
MGDIMATKKTAKKPTRKTVSTAAQKGAFRLAKSTLRKRVAEQPAVRLAMKTRKEKDPFDAGRVHCGKLRLSSKGRVDMHVRMTEEQVDAIGHAINGRSFTLGFAALAEWAIAELMRQRLSLHVTDADKHE